jgi:hypothetical protein
LIWRAAWADEVNLCLEQKGLEERIDHRSFVEQGKNEQPTIHEGVAARAMEKKGIVSDRCELNRQIRRDNALLRQFKAEVQRLVKAVQNSIPALAQAMEKLRANMIIFAYQVDYASGIVTRSREDIPLNLKGSALLSGRVFCGHCGNRLTLTTSGRKRVHSDGTEIHEMRPRYSCHYKPRHPGECDGQSGYGVKKLDDLVDHIVRAQLERIRTTPNSEIISSQHQKTLNFAEARLKMVKAQLTEKQKEIADYKAEAIRVIRGESKFSDELLNTLIEQAKEEESKLAASYEEVKAEIADLSKGMEREREEYDRLISWAEIYSVCPFETKKMFVSQFVKSVRVYRDYELEIEFNVSFEEFRDLRARE